MDANRFDALARALGMPSPRRCMLKMTAGSALGLMGLASLQDRALAKKCNKDKDCSGKDVCKNGKCVECANNSDCNGKDVCKNNKCVECANNSDCKSNERCKNNNCKKKNK